MRKKIEKKKNKNKILCIVITKKMKKKVDF